MIDLDRYEVIDSSHPEYDRQLDLINSLRVPSSQPLYDDFCARYNRLPTGGSLKWRMPKVVPKFNVQTVLKNRGIENDRDYSLEVDQSETEKLKGIVSYTVKKLSDAQCQEQMRGSRKKKLEDLRSLEKILESVSVLSWLKEQARKRGSLPRLPNPGAEHIKPRVILVVPGSVEEIALRQGLPLGTVALLPEAKPKSQRKDLQYMQQLLEEKAAQAPPEGPLSSLDEDDDVGITFG